MIAAVASAPPSPDHSRWAPLSAALGGVVAVVLWVFAVRHAIPRSGRTLETARELGLVSWTTLTGYDTAQESNAWLLGCLLVPMGIWAGWVALAGARVRRTPPPEPEEADAPDPASTELAAPVTARSPLWPPPRWVPWLGVATVVLWAALRPGMSHGPNPWGSFGLLGEEGVYLGAVQAMRTGRTLYSDVAFPYGPLLIQPFDWWLRVAGDTVVAARTWVFLLHGIGLAAVALIVRCLVGGLRGAWAGALACVAMAAISPPFLPVLNSVLLRPALAFLPAALLHAAARDDLPERVHPVRLAGAAIAIAVLFSFEVGAVAVVSSVVTLLLHRASRSTWTRVVTAGGVAGVVGLLPLTLQGGLGGFVGQAFEMIRLPALGYQALPYPDVAAVFRDAGGAFGSHPPENPATRAWAVLPPVVIWVGLGLGLCRLGRRNDHATTGLLVGSVAAALLFRGALGRSDLYHLWFYGAVPVVVLSVVVLAWVWQHASNEVRAGLVPAAALCVIGVAVLDAKSEIAFPPQEEVRLATAAGIVDPMLPRSVDVGRSGRLRLLPRLAVQVDAITRKAASLPEDDGVWFYPSEAAYYYLADRAVPVRYLWAYDAATPAMQKRALADLEEDPPRWVFHSSDTFTIDHIPQEDLVPLIDAWLAENYRPVQVLPGATLLERVGPRTR